MCNKYDPPSYGMCYAEGYAQDGYTPVLRFSEWKELPDVVHVVGHKEVAAQLVINVYADNVSVADIRAFMAVVDSAKLEVVSVNSRNLVTDRNHRVEGSLALCAMRWVEVPKTNFQYIADYQMYVDRIHAINLNTYMVEYARRQAEVDEVQTYLDLHKKYGMRYSS